VGDVGRRWRAALAAVAGLGTVAVLAACGGGGDGGGPPEGEVVLRFATGGSIPNAPVVVGDHVLVELELGSEDDMTGAVVALDPEDFREQWRVQAPGPLRLVRARVGLPSPDDPPLVVRDSVLVAGLSPEGVGSLYRVTLEDGDEAWSVATGPASAPPQAAGDDDRVVFTMRGGEEPSGPVVAVDAGSGDQRWRSEAVTASDPQVVDDAAVYVTTDNDTFVVDLGDGEPRWRSLGREFLAGFDDTFVLADRSGDLVGVEAEDGSEQWRSETPGPSCGAGVRVVDEARLVYVIASCGDPPEAEMVVVVDPSDGTVTGAVDVPRAVGGLDVVGSVAAIASPTEGDLTVVDLDAGEELWRSTIASGTGVALDDDRVYHLDDERLVAADRDDGDEDWSDDQPARFVRPVVADGVVYGAFGEDDDDVVLRALDAGDGEDRWEEPIAVKERALVTVDDDRLYVADASTVYAIE
jgi:outer membrane protein assembly factor BamB